MKAHIARNQNAGVPLALGWNLSSAAESGIYINTSGLDVHSVYALV